MRRGQVVLCLKTRSLLRCNFIQLDQIKNNLELQWLVWRTFNLPRFFLKPNIEEHGSKIKQIEGDVCFNWFLTPSKNIQNSEICLFTKNWGKQLKEEKNTLRPHIFVSVLPPTFWFLILILQFSLPFFKSLPSTRSESIRTPLKSDHLRIAMPSSYFPIYPGPGLNYKP